MRQLLNKIFIAIGILLLCNNSTTLAQETFVEGVISYSVSIGPLAGGTGFSEHAGNYVITIKGKNRRKELVMNSGYRNVLIENGITGSIYSLQTVGGQKYAIQLNAADLLEKQKRYRDFRQTEEEGTMTIAGEPSHKATVNYKDGNSSTLYYTKNWMAPDSVLFDRFPGIKFIPLIFEYRNEEGITMHFAAEKILAQPIESAQFRVPPDYKIISNAEYKALQR